MFGKDPESSKKAFEEFFNTKIDDIEPSKAYDEHLMYYYEVRIEVDGIPYYYLIFDMNNDGKTINDVSFSSDIEGRDAIKKAFEDYCAKAESLYGKPIEEYLNEAANVVNYGISKKVGLSIADYFSDLHAINPNLVLQKIVICEEGAKIPESYLGPKPTYMT